MSAKAAVVLVALGLAGCATPGQGVSAEPTTVTVAAETTSDVAPVASKPAPKRPRPAAFAVYSVVDDQDPLGGDQPLGPHVVRKRELAPVGGLTKVFVHYAQTDDQPGESATAACQRLLAATERVALPEGTQFLCMRRHQRSDEGKPLRAIGWRTVLVESTAALGASAIADAEAQSTEWGSGVAITLTPSAKKVFSDFTAQHTRRRMAMAVDGIVEAQAQVMDRIAGGRVHLSLGSADGPARAQEIARALRRAAGR